MPALSGSCNCREGSEGSQYRRGLPKLCFHFLDAHRALRVQNLRSPLHVMKWTPILVGYAVCAQQPGAPAWPFQVRLKRTIGINRAFALNMMLEKADGHTWPLSATCPNWM